MPKIPRHEACAETPSLLPWLQRPLPRSRAAARSSRLLQRAVSELDSVAWLARACRPLRRGLRDTGMNVDDLSRRIGTFGAQVVDVRGRFRSTDRQGPELGRARVSRITSPPGPVARNG